MQVFHKPTDIALNNKESCITIGNFDGVHLGHKSLIQHTIDICRNQGRASIVVTFWPHPRCVVTPHKGHNPLSTRENRLKLLSLLNPDFVLELDFTKELSQLNPSEFIENYLLPLSLRHLVTGYDFTLGKNRSGHTKELRILGEKYNFTVEQMPALEIDGAIVSSTILRDLIAKGAIAKANTLLGRCYSIEGSVIHGAGRGRGLGFPTANMEMPGVLLPADGVYAAYAHIDGESFNALVNIGTNPSFGQNERSVESFLLDCTKDCYGKHLTLAFLDRLRGERRFEKPQDLTAQIELDTAKAKAIFAASPFR